MDKSCARTGRDKRGEQRLVCPDCTDQRPDPLAAAAVGPKTAVQLAAALSTTLEAASAWLTEGLCAAGVLLRDAGSQRTYWSDWLYRPVRCRGGFTRTPSTSWRSLPRASC
jgi:hypothetical protein